MYPASGTGKPNCRLHLYKFHQDAMNKSSKDDASTRGEIFTSPAYTAEPSDK